MMPRIRAARTADLPAILAIFNHHVVHSIAIWRYAPVDLADRTAWFEDRMRKGFPVIVAESDGQFLGFASYGDFRTGEGYGGTVENSVYVSENAQGLGIGKTLMLSLLDLARAAGKREMVAGIGLPNDASIALHERVGFTERGVLKGIGWKNGQALDLLFMQKSL